MRDPYPLLYHDVLILPLIQGSTPIRTMNVVVVHSLKVLALCEFVLSLDAVINTVKCFPRLEKLYIKVTPYIYQSVHLHFWSLIIT